MVSSKKLYKYHVANLRTVETALDRIALSLRAAISVDESKTVSAFVFLYALILGAWQEVRLRKLLYEPNGFTDTEKKIIQSKQTVLKEWLAALELAFRKQYQIPRARLSARNLTFSAFSRYHALKEMLTEDLQSIILVRNKLAHGQWAYQLNSQGTGIAQDQMKALQTENLLSLQFKRSLVSSLCNTIHDLVVSRQTFERDFDQHYQQVEGTRRNLHTRKYDKYAAQLRLKSERGRVRIRTPLPVDECCSTN